jgi:hypothetical protein
MLEGEGKFLIERSRAQTTPTKTPVLAIIFKVKTTSVSPWGRQETGRISGMALHEACLRDSAP